MIIIDVFRIALLNLCRSKIRTFLTVLGMAVGTASVVIMVSLGIGIKKTTYDTFAATGSLSTISVNRFSWDSGGLTGSEVRLDDRILQEFSELEHVQAVMPVITVNAVLKAKSYVCEVTILAYDEEYLPFGFTLQSGRMPETKKGNGYEIVLPYWIYEGFHQPGELYTAVDVYGNPKVDGNSKLSLTFDSTVAEKQTENMQSNAQTYSLSVVGIMSEECIDFGYYCIMSKDDLLRLAKENITYLNVDLDVYDEISIKCDSYLSVCNVRDRLSEMGYDSFSLQDAIDSAEKNTRQIQYMLGAIGCISALVAALGIINTMLMSIIERSKELGVFKVLGCPLNNIVEIFLAEAFFIGLIGGTIGVVFSHMMSYVLNIIMSGTGFVSIIPVYLPFLAILFAVILSVVAGIYPSIKAMRQSPLAAIRKE